MANRSALVEKLVLTLHLNLDDRKMLRSEPMRASEVATVITCVLKNCGRFSPDATPWQQGRTVFEGHFLEGLPDARVRLWWQRHLATNPYQLGEQKHWDFSDSNRVLAEFVKKEWVELQQGIDSIPIKGD